MAESRHSPNHFDNAGHLDPGRIARLLQLSAEARANVPDEAFVHGSATEDDWAEELGEGVVFTVTSGEDVIAADLNHDVEEDWGGPFLETNGSTEFASGTDASNIDEATREPFPTV